MAREAEEIQKPKFSVEDAIAAKKQLIDDGINASDKGEELLDLIAKIKEVDFSANDIETLLNVFELMGLEGLNT